jgi:regulator of sigma E protease
MTAVLFNIAVFIIVLGVLIFFHEMGHYIAAKACRIYVERFSLGMPPRLAGVRLGETDYCVGALPIGGYVKMAGQEDVPMTDEERAQTYHGVPPERWYNNRPVWQRLIVLVAGPFMNIVLGVLLYGLMGAIGDTVPETRLSSRIGWIEPDSPAAAAPLYPYEQGEALFEGEPVDRGWETGDRIVSIDGEEVRNIRDVAIENLLSGEELATVILERPTEDGDWARYASRVRPEIFGEADKPRFGVAPFMTALVDRVEKGSAADKAGLEAGDIIRRANGRIVDTALMGEMIDETGEGETLALLIERDGETRRLDLAPRTVGGFEDDELLFLAPLEPGEKPGENEDDRVQVVLADPEAFENYDLHALEDGDGPAPPEPLLQAKDVVLTISGERATQKNFHDVIRQSLGEPVTLEIKRPSILFGLFQGEQSYKVRLTPRPVKFAGITWGMREVFYRVPAARWVAEAVHQAWRALELTVATVASLVTGQVSAKELGGPVMIFQATTGAARLGISWLLEIMAFISVNLAVFNLLPLPVLDGGQVALLGVEGVRGKPVGPRTLAVIQQAGLVLIIGLMLFVTWNDIARLLSGMLP